MDLHEKSSTIDYYNNNADLYYRSTIGADLCEARRRFTAYLPDKSTIIDMGCGSGRDVLAFQNMGFDVIGIDASEELAKLAKKSLGIPVIKAEMSTWVSDKPFDGIWCCASLMHLSESECKRFFFNLEYNLKQGGALYISVKSGIETGLDDAGRYMRNFQKEDIQELSDMAEGLRIVELWYTEDSLSRKDFKWLNVIIVKG